VDISIIGVKAIVTILYNLHRYPNCVARKKSTTTRDTKTTRSFPSPSYDRFGFFERKTWAPKRNNYIPARSKVGTFLGILPFEALLDRA
jgi:hypothetical protein